MKIAGWWFRIRFWWHINALRRPAYTFGFGMWNAAYDAETGQITYWQGER